MKTNKHVNPDHFLCIALLIILIIIGCATYSKLNLHLVVCEAALHACHSKLYYFYEQLDIHKKK